MDKKRLIVIIIFIVLFMMAIIASLLYYNGKYSVYFETGTDEVILTKYVKRNDKVEEPIEPTKEGYVFKEWQLDGKTYNFDSRIKKDTVLTAKWIKEEYISITFNTNTNETIKSKKILKGDTLSELPVANKENYEFIGWSLNNNLYNNEQIYDDIELTAEYKNDTINTTYKVGDVVKVIGNYSNSSTSSNAYNKRAIGWERQIINIIINSEFPYVVGNENGVTGFFKANAIERKG
ncbi:MAG: InlB B-repeat-containing protein [Bacilli bacterium]|nr:InlB B-repeat-containing protein [Bacilli bacterium]